MDEPRPAAAGTDLKVCPYDVGVRARRDVGDGEETLFVLAGHRLAGGDALALKPGDLVLAQA